MRLIQRLHPHLAPVLALGLAALLRPEVSFAVGVVWAAEQLVTTAASGAWSVVAADVDADGDLDVLSASANDDTIAWFENTDGLGSFGAEQVIETTANGAHSVVAGDVDGDGDLDAVSASANDDTIAWYENTDGAGSFSAEQVIATTADGAHSAFAADLDGDGDLDVLSASANDDTIAWYENSDGVGGAWLEQTVAVSADGATFVRAADVDGDGDLDVLSASLNDDTIAWYENLDGLGGFGPEQLISTTADVAWSVFTGDVDGDGDLDALSASQIDNTIAWYENTDGQGSFGAEQVITATAAGPISVFAADVDQDGDLDALSTSFSGDRIAWYENTDGLGSFGPAQVIATTADGAVAVIAADVDGDGDLDAVSASLNDNSVAWYENQTIHRRGAFGKDGEITTTADGARSVFAADVDGDDDVDVLAASYVEASITWYENTDGRGAFGTEQMITSSAFGASSIFAADVDRDGDLDALSASEADDTIAWYENLDGQGGFGPEQAIATTVDGAASVFAADVDGDGDLDALAASVNDDTIAWYENTDGQGSFGPEQALATTADGARCVFAADVDGDDDLDVLAASVNDDTIAWYENTDGQGGFGAALAITTTADGAASVFAADVDGDGDLDALSASELDDTIAWYENADGQGSFGPAQPITTSADGARSVFAADVDADGDLDALSASTDGDTIAWYENLDGLGSFAAEQAISTTADGATSVFAMDVDGDGDLDALSASELDDTIAWYDNADSQGGFAAKAISTNAGGANSVFAADLDADGDLDVLSANQAVSTIAWYENADGQGGFAAGQVITAAASLAQDVDAADLDGDGDLDALSASLNDDTIAWYENTDGQGSFGAEQVITATADSARSVFAADIDGDGDADVLAASSSDSTIAWYENTDGQGSFGSEQAITTTALSANGVFAADLDGDGDLDALASSSSDNTIAWYENTNGLGSFGLEQVISTTADGPQSVFAADVDGDGDVDALSAIFNDDTIAWYENVDGQGGSWIEQLVTTTADMARSVFAADVDRDGDLDVLSASRQDDTIAWYENTTGQGSFGPKRLISTKADQAQSVIVADVDGDGDLDALSASSSDNTLAKYANRSGQASFTTTSTAPTAAIQGDEVNLMRFDVAHLGRAGEADAELGSLVLQLHRTPGSPLTSEPAGSLTSAEANALIENLFVYRDDGSGVLETGTDDLVATVTTLALSSGIQTIALTNADPDVQIAATGTARFFVVAELTAAAGAADPRAFRVSHASGRSEIQHTGTSVVLAQAPGGGTRPRLTTVLDPAGDEDGDGLTNAAELDVHGTDPLAGDSDDDDLSDSAEINIHGTSPLLADSDGDGLTDGAEINTHGTDPLVSDTDGDGLVDGGEITAGTNPFDSDSDDDGLSDGDEVNVHGTDPLADDDLDFDSISDADEVARGMNPALDDTDGDGYLDPSDNCPSAYNPDQLDQAGFGTPMPDGVGDLCQNGDFNRDGEVDILDTTLQRRGLIGLEPDLDPALPPSSP